MQVRTAVDLTTIGQVRVVPNDTHNTTTQVAVNHVITGRDNSVIDALQNLAFAQNIGRTFDQRAERDKVANLSLRNLFVINDTLSKGSGVANGVNAATMDSEPVRTAQRDVWDFNFETQVQMEVECRLKIERANKDKTCHTINNSLTDIT